MPKTTKGTELMQRLAEGSIAELPSKYLEETRSSISTELEEMIEVGARIRPLLVDEKRVGWVRGVSLVERRMIQRWLPEENELLMSLLKLATSFTEDELRDFTLVEVRSISRVIRSMTESDLRLYPYLYPYASTASSEQLWYSQGKSLTDFRNKEIQMPDGKTMRISIASDQARMWATLCEYRCQAKAKLEDSFNTVLIIRPWVGKGTDTLTANLKTIARQMKTDSLEPWQEVIRMAPDRNYDDGWAHSEDDSVEGLRRELTGMLGMDKHERTMLEWERQMREREEQRIRKIERAQKQKDSEPSGFVIVTPEEVRKGVEEAQKVGPRVAAPEEPQSSLLDRLSKYK